MKDVTITYLKSERHPGVFYLINAANEAVELSFIEAASIFKTDKKEISQILPVIHHQQVNQALSFFTRERNLQSVNTPNRTTFSPVERRVLPKIEFCARQATGHQQAIIKKAIDSIYKGIHKQIANDLNNFFNNNTENNQTRIVENLCEQVLKKYNFQANGHVSSTDQSSDTFIDRTPIIVISESFS